MLWRMLKRFWSLPERGPLTQQEKIQRDNQNVLTIVLTVVVLIVLGLLPVTFLIQAVPQ